MKRLMFVVAVLAALMPMSRANAAQGSGNPILSVSDSSLPAEGKTITVTGRDYLVPPHAPGTNVFGGVYVFFGWVAGGDWGPSARNSNNNNGTFGVTYAYPGDGGDPSTRGDQGGTMRFVSFTSGGASGDTTEYHMNDNGDWSVPLKIKGSTFTTESSSGTKTYNCRQVQCGVFTIGAHGIASKTNEKFTPVSFAAPKTPTPEPTNPPTTKPTTKPTAKPSATAKPAASTPAAKAATEPPAVAGAKATPKASKTPGRTPRRTTSSDATDAPDSTSAGTVDVDLDRPTPSADADAFASSATESDGGGGSGGALAIVGGAGGVALAGIAGALAVQRRRRRNGM